MMMKGIPFIAIALSILATACQTAVAPQETGKPRTIVTTDGECDDYDSFIRLLLYANDMDIEAIVYSASQWHWEGDGKGTLLVPENRVEGRRGGMAPRFDAPVESFRWIGRTWVQDLIDAYAVCYPNLLKHDAGYPSPEYLHSIVKTGNTRVEGDMAQPTEGSEYIKDIFLDEEPGPVYAQIWGGTNTVARALLSIEEEYKEKPEWEQVYRKVSDKVILHIIQDQDGTYRNYVEKNWPEIRTVYNGFQFFSFAYMWPRAVPQPFLWCLKGDWFEENVLEGHGPLTAKYLGLGSGYDLGDPDDDWGTPAALARTPGSRVNDFISEGDSPSFFLLLDFGLRSLDHPEWGSVGGRFDASRPRFWTDASDLNPYTGEKDRFYPQTRWVEVLQNDFAARADWCVKDYADANHRPVVSVKGTLDRTAKPGETVTLKAAASDPDGNSVSFRWWQYCEAGTSPVQLSLEGADAESVSFVIPADAAPGTTLHVILEGADDGTPVLKAFQRVIITIK